MERKKFLLTTAAAIPALLVGQNLKAEKPRRPIKSFVVKATESRFGENHCWVVKAQTTLKSLKKIQMAIYQFLNIQEMKKVDRHFIFTIFKMKYFIFWMENIYFKLARNNTI